MVGEREEEASSLGGSGPVFPEDVIIEIFSRLSVKILMQLKCVCKSWYSIISTPTPYFISRHLLNYYHNKSNDHGRLLIQYNDYPQPPLDDINPLFLDPTLVDVRHQNLDVPLPNTFMLGPCDGIYFLNRNGSPFYALWNPATHECKVLPEIPKPKFPSCRYYTQVDGFGFDQTTQGFKVVIIRHEGYQCCGESFPSEALIYSSNSNSWCYFELPWDFYPPFSSTCYMHLNGVYYWIAQFKRSKFLLSFDMATNLFHQVTSAPPSEKNSYGELVLLGDSIAWIYDANPFLHVWVLNQDENGCSWTKKYSVVPRSEGCRPIGYWKNDQLILKFIDGLHLYDLTKQTPKGRNLGIAGYGYYRALIYKESLVCINGEKLVPGEIYASWRERFIKGILLPPCPNDYVWEPEDGEQEDDEEQEEEEEI